MGQGRENDNEERGRQKRRNIVVGRVEGKKRCRQSAAAAAAASQLCFPSAGINVRPACSISHTRARRSTGNADDRPPREPPPPRPLAFSVTRRPPTHVPRSAPLKTRQAGPDVSLAVSRRSTFRFRRRPTLSARRVRRTFRRPVSLPVLFFPSVYFLPFPATAAGDILS